MAKLTIALAGNPNAGKSTIFNMLTGLNQHTGNWPGKTVAMRTGWRNYNGASIEFIDLPGTYSLAAYSPEELVARQFIINEHPDGVLCTVDATNLERNLYLVVQLLELGVPVILALNLSDQARRQGIDIDHHLLSRLLGDVPVVPTVATRREGIDHLLATMVRTLSRPAGQSQDGGGPACGCAQGDAFQIPYGGELEKAIQQVTSATQANKLPLNGCCRRWLALKLLEGESDVVAQVVSTPGGQAVVHVARAESAELESQLGDEVEILMADRRYRLINEISRQVTQTSPPPGVSLTERIDRLVAHRLLGLPIFLLVMYVVFRLVIDVSAPFLDWVDALVNGPVSAGLSAVLKGIGAAPWLHSLVVDGIVAGVGGVLTFVPGLVVLFFFLAMLEDTGYMARAAFVMDRFMRFIGLHGKSVIPLMLGFGCAVPAIYATRTIAGRRDRLLTALLIPLMSCSARLPVYVVFALAFFGRRAGTVIWSLYVFGVVVALVVGFVFSRTLLKPDDGSAFVLELPPYRRPTFRSLLLHTWDNTRQFIRNAGTVILAVSVVLWLLLNLPWGVTERQESYYGRLSASIAPALEPAGFGTWENSGALVSGFIAKELVVSSLAQIYLDDGSDVDSTSAASTSEVSHEGFDVSLEDIWREAYTAILGLGQATIDAGRTLISLFPGVNLVDDGGAVEDTSLSRAVQDHFTPLTAMAFLVFVLLYVPCAATMGAIKQEFGARWAALSAVYQTSIAWLAAVVVYQIGRLLT